jgi:hypothetical protein
MPYNFELAMSADVSAEVVIEMVTNRVREQTGKNIDEVIIKIEDNQFKGFKIMFDTEQAELVYDDKTVEKKPKVIDKKWKPFIWE